MSELIRLTEPTAIFSYIKDSIQAQTKFLLWPENDEQFGKILELSFKSTIGAKAIVINFRNCSSTDIEYLKKSPRLCIKDKVTGLFFKTKLNPSKNETTIPVPKILNLKNGRFKERQIFGRMSLVKVAGEKKINNEQKVTKKFTGKLFDFHFNGLSLIIHTKDLSLFNKEEDITIIKINDIHLERKIEGNIRYIRKFQEQEDGQIHTYYRMGLFCKSKIPPAVIFLLNKEMAKKNKRKSAA